MWSRRKRLTTLGMLATGAAVGALLEPALDPLEDDGLAWVGLLAGMAVFAAVGGYWYSRALESIDEVDERQAALERRASRLGHGVLLAGVAGLALVLVSLPWLSVPVAPVLWALLVASAAVHELSIEYYRRRM